MYSVSADGFVLIFLLQFIRWSFHTGNPKKKYYIKEERTDKKGERKEGKRKERKKKNNLVLTLYNLFRIFLR